MIYKLTFPYFYYRVSLGALLFGWILNVAASTVIAPFAPNGVILTTAASASYKGEFGTVIDDLNDDFQVAAPDISPPVSSTSGAGIIPFSGEPKDKISGQVTLKWEYGSPVGSGATDRFTFDAFGEISAVSAEVVAGENADFGRLDLSASLTFFLDPLFGGLPAGTHIGDLFLPDLPALLPFEVNSGIKVLETPAFGSTATVLELFPGSPGGVVQLLAGNEYIIGIFYSAEVPFGVDPPFSINYSGNFSPSAVPLPATFWLMGFSLVLLAGRRKK